MMLKKVLLGYVAVALTILVVMNTMTIVNDYVYYSDEEIMSEFIDHTYGNQCHGELIFTKNGSNHMAINVFDEYGTLIDSRFINKTETMEKYCE